MQFFTISPPHIKYLGSSQFLLEVLKFKLPSYMDITK